MSDDRIVIGSLLHDAGPATVNARSPKFVILCFFIAFHVICYCFYPMLRVPCTSVTCAF